jgi:hypothetical protein
MYSEDKDLTSCIESLEMLASLELVCDDTDFWRIERLWSRVWEPTEIIHSWDWNELSRLQLKILVPRRKQWIGVFLRGCGHEEISGS